MRDHLDRTEMIFMGSFPLFIDLTGQKVVIAGGGTVAARKVHTLRAFGADIYLVSPEVTPEIAALGASGVLHIDRRPYRSDDLTGSRLAVAATGNTDVNRGVYRDAVARGIPVNVVDQPQLCTFLFPAVVARGDLVIGVTSSGGCPALAKIVRQRLDDLFPPEYSRIAEALREFRARCMREVSDPVRRRQVNRALAAAAMELAGSVSWENTPRRLDEVYRTLTAEACEKSRTE